MRYGDNSVNAVRITLVSTPRKVRTRVVIANAIMRKLAATPSRFQPIHFLKPRPSVVSSPYIHPPGGAAVSQTDCSKCRSEPQGRDNNQSIYVESSIRQKAFVVQSLTTSSAVFDQPSGIYLLMVEIRGTATAY